MGTDKIPAMFRYSVHMVNGEHSSYLETTAAYIQTDDGFMEFKNSSNETVLTVNSCFVLSVVRGHHIEESCDNDDITPEGYRADVYGNTTRDR